MTEPPVAERAPLEIERPSTTIKEAPQRDAYVYSHDRSDRHARGISSNVAAQQELGLLPRWRRKRGHTDHSGTAVCRQPAHALVGKFCNEAGFRRCIQTSWPLTKRPLKTVTSRPSSA
jgi:hypothetical protein